MASISQVPRKRAHEIILSFFKDGPFHVRGRCWCSQKSAWSGWASFCRLCLQNPCHTPCFVLAFVFQCQTKFLVGSTNEATFNSVSCCILNLRLVSKIFDRNPSGFFPGLAAELKQNIYVRFFHHHPHGF